MEPKEFPILLEKVFFTRSTVVAMPQFKPGADVNFDPENQLDLAEIEGEKNRFLATMRTVINKDQNQSQPYMIDMECIAMFTVKDQLEGDEAKRGTALVAHNVLYGALREAICTITARQPYGPVLLGLSLLQSNAPPPAQ